MNPRSCCKCLHINGATKFCANSYYYTINGAGVNPTLTLVQGRTYTFLVNASAVHPFFIDSPGVQNNDISQGTITYTVPSVASNYTYICSIHGFGGKILTVAPPPPPPA